MMASEDDQELWYHDLESVATRDEAEKRLRQAGFTEGLFLVRDCSKAPGDYVMSVVVKEEVIHYQIRRWGQEAFFSLAEQDKV